jgi:HprK-related kinase A
VITSRERTLDLVDTRGLQIRVGPFLVHVRSELTGVADHLRLLYGNFPMYDREGGHFDIAIVRGRGLHRWVRPQASLVVNTAKPFLPLPANLAGPLLEWGINWCIGNNAHQWVAVHAAVVERGGHAVLLTAPPGYGKSTLCAALICAGWRLFSDEFALIEPETGRVVPVPRPVSLKEAAIEVIRHRTAEVVFSTQAVDMEGDRFVHMRPPPESVRRADEPAHPRCVIVPRYIRGQATTLDPLTKAQALIQLADQSFNYNYLGARGYSCLVNVVRQCDCYRLEYSDLDDVLALLDRVS